MNKYKYNFYEESDKFVCATCIHDIFFSRKIRFLGEKKKCDFCGKEKCCIPVNELLNRYMKYINFCYDDSDEEGIMDGGEFIFTPNDIWDLNEEYIDYNSSELTKYIKDRINLERHFNFKLGFYGNSLNQDFKYTWEDFCEKVKNKKGFLKSKLCSVFLEDLWYYLKKYGFISKIRKNTKIYRLRENTDFEPTAENLGTPPKKIAQRNRMSRKGDPMFYGSINEETCKAELFSTSSQKIKSYTMGIWTLCSDVYLVDMTKLSYKDNVFLLGNKRVINSIYNSRQLNKLIFLDFMIDFIKDISKPIKKTKKNIEYKPTQVLCKFFLKKNTKNKKKILGIKYYSAQTKTGINYALKIPNEECRDCSDGKIKQKIKLVDFRKKTV